MAEVARLIEAPLKSEHYSDHAVSSMVDEDLSTRIHSLLAARHGHHLPKAPCPSPDFDYSAYDPDGHYPSYPSINPRSNSFSVAKTIAKLALLKPQVPNLVSSGYDGPAGQIDDNDKDESREHPSQPKPDQDIVVGQQDTTKSRATPGLSHLASGVQNGRSHRRSDGPGTLPTVDSPSRAVSISSKRSTRSRMPVYALRTVPPHSSHLAEVPLKPEVQHIPGSFQTESQTSTPRGYQTPPEALDARSITEHSLAEPAHPYLEPAPGMHSRAVEALTKARGHDSLDSTLDSGSLRRETSLSTLGSTTSTAQSYRPPSRLFIGESNFSEAAEPVMTSGSGEGYRYSEGFTPLPLSTGKEITSGREMEAGPSDAHTENAEVEDNDSAARDFVRSANPLGPPLPELLARLPPVTEVIVDDLDDRQIIIKRPGNSEPLSMTTSLPSRRTTVLYSPEVDNSSVDPSSAPRRTTGFGNSEKAEDPVPEIGLALDRDADTTSAPGRRLSSLNSAASGSSAISLRSGLQMPFLGSSTPYGNFHAAEQESRIRKSPSLPSLRNSQSSGQSDDIRLLKQSNTAGRTKPEPKEHWIRTFLTPGQSNSPKKSQANLTARPSRRPSSSANSAKRRLSENPFVEIQHPAFGEPEDPFHLLNAVSGEEKVIKYQDQKRAASFKGVIQDLEKLLKEALVVAKLGTDSSSHKVNPMPPGYPLLNSSSLKSINHADSLSSLIAGPDIKGNDTTLPSPSMANSESRHESHFVKNPNKTTYPGRSVAPTRHQSIALASKSNNDGIKRVSTEDKVVDSPAVSLSDVSLIVKHPSQNTQKTIPGPTGTPVQLNNVDNSLASCHIQDWAFAKQSLPQLELKPMGKPSSIPRQPDQIQPLLKEQNGFVMREHKPSLSTTPKPPYAYRSGGLRPVIQPRTSSVGLRSTSFPKGHAEFSILQSSNEDFDDDIQMTALQPSGGQYRSDTQHTLASNTTKPARMPSYNPGIVHPLEVTVSSDLSPQEQGSLNKGYSLKNRRHFSIREGHGFSLSRSHRRAPIARDWSKSRKRYVATVTCINTALMGLIIGIYAGEVPAIQYAIVDEHHYTILGNVVFFLGLAISTALFWPLPLLHGRNPYTRAALALLLPLQFPQALAVGSARSPYVATYRVGLLLPRAISGIIMGFANVNFKTTLLDLFGASLQSSNPHQEMVNTDDVRRHGGGMGIWLGIWTWCSIGSIGVGFLIGAAIINGLDVSWGFWITIILTAFTLILNVLVPEVRRSAYRRSMAEVRSGREVSRRIARGEIKMHIDSTGPIWWGEELTAGYKLCLRMLKQPGFFILSFYIGWIYGQIVMVIVHDDKRSGNMVLPFGSTGVFHDRTTIRGLAYTLASGGVHTHFMIPTIFAGLIGFLSNLAIAECNGIIMETYDTSDLQPGMTGRRRVIPEELRQKTTNFSCFPRVSAAFAVTQSFAYVIAAAATGCGGVVERRLGAQTATAAVAAVLLVLTVLLIGVLWRFKEVQIIPSQRFGTNVLTGPENEWKPIIIGRPSGTTRRMSLLELGAQSRWAEIRRRNKLMGPDES